MPPPEIQSNTLRLQQQWAVGTESTWSRNDAHDTAQHNYSAPEIEEQNAGSLYRQGNQHDFVYPQQGKEEAHFIRPRQYSVCDGIGYQHYNPPNGTGGLPLRSRHEKIHQPDISLIPPPTRGPSRGPLAPFHPPTFVRQNLNFPGRLDTPSSPSTFPPPRSATSHSTARPLTTPRRNGGLNSVSSPFFHEAAPSRPASVASHANAYSRGGGPMITIKPSRLFDRSGRGSASRDSHRHTDVNGSQ